MPRGTGRKALRKAEAKGAPRPSRSRPKSGNLGLAIRRLREESGISRYALAKAAAIDYAVLSRLEAGSSRGVQFLTVIRVAEALDVSLDELASVAGLSAKRSAAGTRSHFVHLISKAQRAQTRLVQALNELKQITDPGAS